MKRTDGADVDALFRLGNMALSRGRPEEAIDCFQRALRVRPDAVGCLNNLGNAYRSLSRPADAVAAYQQALRVDPLSPILLNNIGNAYRELGESEKAFSFYGKALAADGNYAEAHNNLGNLFFERRQVRQAVDHLSRALALRPDNADILKNLGEILQETGDLETAIDCYQAALRLCPSHCEAFADLYYARRLTCDWEKSEPMADRLEEMVAQALSQGARAVEKPFINLIRCADPLQNLRVATSWSDPVARRMASLGIRFERDRSRPAQKITVGYLSGDFREHPVGHLVRGLFEAHDRRDFNIHCYSLGADDGGETRRRIRAGCDRFVDLGPLSDPQAARLIFTDAVDILIDMMGHTMGNRLGISALRPAPVQVSYLGFPGSTGADFLDYFITDAIATPAEAVGHFSEKVVVLPGSALPFDRRFPISDRIWKKADFGLPETGVVFCSFNTPYKMEPGLFDIWMRILHEVEGAVLWLFRKNDRVETNLKRYAAGKGVDPNRLIFSDMLPIDEHLRRLALADAALDTAGYNGGATSVNALWAGVPLITLAGNRFVSRMSAGCLHAVGLSELVAPTPEAYLAIAVQLGSNPMTLKAIRERLAVSRMTASLFDTGRYVRNLESAYRAMWRIHRAGEAPRQIGVADAGESVTARSLARSLARPSDGRGHEWKNRE